MNENFYHIFNRGVEKRKIFTNESDFKRFLKTLQYYQIEGFKPRFSRYIPELHGKLLADSFSVEIIVYCLMPNHFHLLVKQITESGVSKYISQLTNSYTKYFNTKYDRVGPLFQGNFKAVLIENTEQLLHTSRYIHLNPLVSGLETQLGIYGYSSLSEYLTNSKPEICSKNYVLSEFTEKSTYKGFIEDHADYAISLEIIKHQLLEDE